MICPGKKAYSVVITAPAIPSVYCHRCLISLRSACAISGMIDSRISKSTFFKQVDPIVRVHILAKPQHGMGVTGFQASLLSFERKLFKGFHRDVVADLQQYFDDNFGLQVGVLEILCNIRGLQVTQGVDVAVICAIGVVRPNRFRPSTH